MNYPIKKTGYFCVGTYGYSAEDYKAVVEFRNAYGELQAAQIANLPFYGGLTIVYAVMGMYGRQHAHIINFEVTDFIKILGLSLRTKSARHT